MTKLSAVDLDWLTTAYTTELIDVWYIAAPADEDVDIVDDSSVWMVVKILKDTPEWDRQTDWRHSLYQMVRDNLTEQQAYDIGCNRAIGKPDDWDPRNDNDDDDDDDDLEGGVI